MKLPNDYHVKKLKYITKAFVYCPLGKDWGYVDIIAEIEMGEELPNYNAIDEFIISDIEGKEHITEEVGYLVWEFIKNLIKPKNIKVLVHSNNQSIHDCWTTIE